MIAMLLSDVHLKNTSVKVCAYVEGYSEKAQERLKNLGIKVNKKIIVLQRLPFGGPLVVQAGLSVFSLSLEIAQCVYVELWDQPEES